MSRIETHKWLQSYKLIQSFKIVIVELTHLKNSNIDKIAQNDNNLLQQKSEIVQKAYNQLKLNQTCVV